ncbi:MAG: type II toxin-antitoxin system HicB family antitoxin [Desulfosalsimonadaceae bacterium]
MITSYTAKYTKIKSGYMGQLIEWPEVVTEGKDIDECRAMLRDALNEMIAAYYQQEKEIPGGNALLEHNYPKYHNLGDEMSWRRKEIKDNNVISHKDFWRDL